MDKQSYRERWFRKLKTYEKIGIIDRLITTSESEERTDVGENIKNIVKDLKTKKLKKHQRGILFSPLSDITTSSYPNKK